MEVEKMIKKRVIREEDEESERVKKKNRNNNLIKGEEGPTEEEVDEFFAILRRMKVAVKYFDEKGRGGKEWREALETAEVTVDHRQDVAAGQMDDYMAKKKAGEEVIVNEDFDLNAVAPEAAEIGGA